ncbi:GreA/GreB family elongation factor [Streptacidiphilus sp. N1-10]|uniref:GreA/GreB family elongation factor n=1 Tax=Streptacidiphilus jeojiensis TaxID=3229225 RepID=A0ABV6XH18_9ACTN
MAKEAGMRGAGVDGEAEPISDTARRALERDLAELRAERQKVAATLGDADEAGDSADQADELQRADDLTALDDRIAELETRLRQSALAGPPRTDVVGVGSTATVRFGDDSTQAIQIGEVAEELDETLVTADSPLGRALLGHRVGETVAYATPRGQDTATVLTIGG